MSAKAANGPGSLPPIQLVVGLGNPGPDYVRTRHNAGFWFADALARELGADPFRKEARFHAELSQLRLRARQVRIQKPLTYMNRSGQAVASLAHYFNVPRQAILVVHDELDLPPGQARLKREGGHGGHNGLRDLIAHLGGRDFPRLRLGIGHPGSREQVTGYVLGRPGRDEEQAIEAALGHALAVMPLLFEGDFDRAMNQLHAAC